MSDRDERIARLEALLTAHFNELGEMLPEVLAEHVARWLVDAGVIFADEVNDMAKTVTAGTNAKLWRIDDLST